MTTGGGEHKTKVAVLGGGIGAITAAFELTEPHLRGRYEVTVYQPGWRLGGKCASGRRGKDRRIEEHGLHVWFGFYANAFQMIQRCYEEWSPPDSYPIRTWDAAFKQCNDIVLFEQWGDRWTPWHITLPPDDEVPGHGHIVEPWEFVHGVVRFLLGEWQLMRHRTVAAGAATATGARSDQWGLPPLAARLGYRLEQGAVAGLLEGALKLAGALAESPARRRLAHHHLRRLEELLRGVKHLFFRVVFDPWVESDDVRRFAIMLDLGITILAGLIADDVFEVGFGKLNREDLWAWLRRHGAQQLTLDNAAVIKALYDLVFAYRDGDKQRPDLAAGKALQAMIRIAFEYKGAALWKMQAGMGDTVFTPLYDVLRRRGVRFRFFHQVTNIGVSDDGRSVAKVEVQPQVRLRRRHYDPIVTVDGLRCWPSEPRWSQLVGGDKLEQRDDLNFEYDCNPLGLEPITLHAGEDFDEVVLGISAGALPAICGELVDANPRFKRMLDHADTVMTEGIQLWLCQEASQSGWQFESAIATSYVECADTYSNMSQLLQRERWPGPECPRDVVYLCGVIDHKAVDSQARADRRVRDNAVDFLTSDAEAVWPTLVDADGGFDWSGLFDCSGAEGEARLDAQFLRANFQPTERYVMTRAGSLSYRLAADESGFDNLKLAGDWTRNGLDGGSVEAAVTSGMQASRAISGSPREIQGETGWLVDD
jgi:uncharacterized protein with NAD-binding domain and iron-sulfur cluster